jgi:hypothetical protein
MTNEQLRMQMLAGVITEGEYKAKLEEASATTKFLRKIGWAGEDLTPKELAAKIKKLPDDTLIAWSKDKNGIPNTPLAFQQKLVKIEMAKRGLDQASLNESMIGGIVGIGAITQIPATPKTDYEMAFEHFLGERYQLKPNRERDDIKDVNEDDSYNDMDQQISDEVNEVGDDSYKKNLLDLIITGEKQLIDLEKLKGKVPNIDSSIAKAKEVVDGLKASLEGTNEGKEVEEGIHDKDITSAPHTNVKGEMGAYNPKQRAANLAKLQNFGPKDKK